MKDQFVVIKPNPDVSLPLNSISTVHKNIRGQIFFDNGNLKMCSLGEETFNKVHQPFKKFILECLYLNALSNAIQVLSQTNWEDFPLVSGNYHAAIQHKQAGGSFESTEHQLSKVRMAIWDYVRKN